MWGRKKKAEMPPQSITINSPIISSSQSEPMLPERSKDIGLGDGLDDDIKEEIESELDDLSQEENKQPIIQAAIKPEPKKEPSDLELEEQIKTLQNKINQRKAEEETFNQEQVRKAQAIQTAKSRTEEAKKQIQEEPEQEMPDMQQIVEFLQQMEQYRISHEERLTHLEAALFRVKSTI